MDGDDRDVVEHARRFRASLGFDMTAAEMQAAAASNLAAARASLADEREREEVGGLGDSLVAVLRRCAEHAASPEAIAAYEASVAECRDREARERRQQIADRLDALRLPVRGDVIEHLLAGKLEDWESLRRTRLWLSVPSKVLVLIGDVGQGKTVAAAYAAMRCLERGVRYVKEPQLVQWTQHVSREPQMDELRDVSLLVVDEVGTAETRHSEAAAVALTDLIDTRLGGRKRTIVCGNVPTVEAFVQRYGVRLADRLRESGIIVELRGGSRRRSAT